MEKGGSAIKGRITACVMAALILSGCGTKIQPLRKLPDNTSAEAGLMQTEPIGNVDNGQEAPAIAFSRESGVYADGFALEMTASGGELYYTTDGSDPVSSPTRIRYEAPIVIADRSGEPNVVSAVPPEKITANFCEYDAESGSLRYTVEAPEDGAVDKCSVINAAVIAPDGSATEVFTRTYFIGTPAQHIKGLAESCAASGGTLAVMSISVDADDFFDSERGIYVRGDIFDRSLSETIADGWDITNPRLLAANYDQRGRKWERPCRAELLEFGTDGAQSAFAQSCGIRIQGNYSRSDWQKGLRLYARKEYGKKRFEYPVFGEELRSERGETIDKFKRLELRAGGESTFIAKFNDAYWQELSAGLDISTKASRPCVVYLNGEYWGLYVLEEDHSDDYLEAHYGTDKDAVVVYKGDDLLYLNGYKLDEGSLPDGVTDEDYYLRELLDMQDAFDDLSSQEDFDSFTELVDTDSFRDYFLAEIWADHRLDWPRKNWAMWKYTGDHDPENEYTDGRWRLMLYDLDYCGASGAEDAYMNTVLECGDEPLGLLDTQTNNPMARCFALLMTNYDFRADFCGRLNEMSESVYEREYAEELLDRYTAVYSPLFGQFFGRYPGSGSADDALNGRCASVSCLREFIEARAEHIPEIVSWIEGMYYW